MSLIPSRCSCYPLFVEFAVGVTNRREMERAPKSLWCVCLLLCAGELRNSKSPPRRVPRPPFHRSREEPWGTRQKEEGRRGKEVREKAEEEALAVVLLSLPAEARWPDRRGRGWPPTSSLCYRCGSSGVPLARPRSRASSCRMAWLAAQRTPSSINVTHGLCGIVSVHPTLSRVCALKCTCRSLELAQGVPTPVRWDDASVRAFHAWDSGGQPVSAQSPNVYCPTLGSALNRRAR
jgi:hypothetical protein